MALIGSLSGCNACHCKWLQLNVNADSSPDGSGNYCPGSWNVSGSTATINATGLGAYIAFVNSYQTWMMDDANLPWGHFATINVTSGITAAGPWSVSAIGSFIAQTSGIFAGDTCVPLHGSTFCGAGSQCANIYLFALKTGAEVRIIKNAPDPDALCSMGGHCYGAYFVPMPSFTGWPFAPSDGTNEYLIFSNDTAANDGGCGVTWTGYEFFVGPWEGDVSDCITPATPCNPCTDAECTPVDPFSDPP
jgi:hypothetical protein